MRSRPIGPVRVLLSVQDSGPGVNPDIARPIFERFRQAQNGATREFGGTGLGLAIAKDFADLHGGTIAVSDVGRGGTLFQVEIPRYAPEGTYVRAQRAGALQRCHARGAGSRGRTNAARRREEARRRGEKSRRVVRASWWWKITPRCGGSSPGYLAGNTASYLPPMAKRLSQRRWRNRTWSSTDLMMPKMGGDRLVAEMRARRSLAQVPIIVLSAKADEELRVKLLNESVQDYVVNPSRLRNCEPASGTNGSKRMRDVLQLELDSQSTDVAELSGHSQETGCAGAQPRGAT